MTRKTLESTRPSPNAVPTTKGWIDPLTGELLVAIKNLVDRIPPVEPKKRGRGRPKKNPVQ